jgi:hypothetical protein
MRWLLADPQVPQENAWRQHVAAATEKWWWAFQANASNIAASFSQPGTFDIVRFMDDNLGAIDPRLCWEYGAARRTNGGHRLVITPEAEHWLRPMLGHVLSRAPNLPGWEFYAHRLPESAAHARLSVKGRCGVEFRQAGIEARIGQHQKIDVLYTFPQEKWSEDQARNVAFVLTETLLGEETLDGWIGVIDAVDPREPGHRWLPLERAGDTVSAVAQSMLEQLPAEPLFRISKENAQWLSYKMEPEGGGDDYPLRSDLIVGSACSEKLIEGMVSGRLFDSRCHSRCGEYFCYLKIDADEVPSEHRVEFRAELEDPLDEALMQAGFGGVIGGGSGIRYSYVDLSLTQVMQAVPLIRQVLAQRRAPVRTWLLFFDTQFEKEWLGVHPQTPPPPVVEEPQE